MVDAVTKVVKCFKRSDEVSKMDVKSILVGE